MANLGRCRLQAKLRGDRSDRRPVNDRSAGMPGPVSETSRIAPSGIDATRTETLPPSGCSAALSTRLRSKRTNRRAHRHVRAADLPHAARARSAATERRYAYRRWRLQPLISSDTVLQLAAGIARLVPSEREQLLDEMRRSVDGLAEVRARIARSCFIRRADREAATADERLSVVNEAREPHQQ